MTNKYITPVYILRTVGITLVIAGLVWYAWIQVKPLLLGPEIILRVLRSGDEIAHSPLYIEGAAERSVRISVNTKPVPLVNQRLFNHTVALAPGVNVIDITAEDRFNKTTTKTIEIYYTPEKSPMYGPLDLSSFEIPTQEETSDEEGS